MQQGQNTLTFVEDDAQKCASLFEKLAGGIRAKDDQIQRMRTLLQHIEQNEYAFDKSEKDAVEREICALQTTRETEAESMRVKIELYETHVLNLEKTLVLRTKILEDNDAVRVGLEQNQHLMQVFADKHAELCTTLKDARVKLDLDTKPGVLCD